MTRATKDRLAAALRAEADKATGNILKAETYRRLANRAETGEFDEYGDAHICGPTALLFELMAAGLRKFASRVAAGEFDATAEESEAWARSQTDSETIRLMNIMGIGPDRKRDA